MSNSNSNKGQLRDYVLNIAPGAQVPVQANGNYFRILDADAGVITVTTSAGDALTVREGEGARVRPFARLDFRNDSGVTRRVEVLVGTGEFESARLTGEVTQKAAGTISAIGDVAGGGTIAANPERRQLVMRAGIDNAGAVTIAGLPVYPGDVMELDVTGAVAVGGAAGDVLHVAEVV